MLGFDANPAKIEPPGARPARWLTWAIAHLRQFGTFPAVPISLTPFDQAF